jgi:hypothetical protein
MAGSEVGTRTITATPVLLNADGTDKTGRVRLRIYNLSTTTRLRVGTASANLQRDGQPVEPQDSLTLYPTAPIYGCSEGAAIKNQIEEK